MVRARNYVAAFIKSFYRRNDMSMLELTLDFIKEFAAYLTAERGLKNATIWLNCIWLKGVVMRAHYNGLIPRNPFAQFHISPNVKEREYLTEDEIKRVMAHEFGNPTLALVRDLFIFACYTGVSYADVVSITNENLYTDEDGALWLKYRRKKNEHRASVKLLPEALALLEKYKDDTRGTLFPIIHYLNMKRHMKALAALAGIKDDLCYIRHAIASPR